MEGESSENASDLWRHGTEAAGKVSKSWRVVLGRTLGNVRRERQRSQANIPTEFQRYSKEQINMLMSLIEASPSAKLMPSQSAQVKAIKLMNGDSAFTVQCLLSALDSSDSVNVAKGSASASALPPKFLTVFALVERATANKELSFPDGDIWSKAFPSIMEKALEEGSADEKAALFKEALSLAHDSVPAKLPGHPPLNSPVLLRACERDQYAHVRALVSRGYRLKLNELDVDSKAAKEARGEMSMGELMQMPMAFMSDTKGDLQEEDDVFNLLVMRMMAKPSYIIACYLSMAEKRYLEICKEEMPEDGAVDTCECQPRERPNSPISSNKRWYAKKKKSCKRQRMGLNEAMAKEVSSEAAVPFHYCPVTAKYRPHPDCQRHLECNDPIYRCFELAKLASRSIQRTPEYKKEYEEIIGNCRGLAASLLDQCQSSQEVTTLLSEKAASVKYFGPGALFMKYPRMKVAIEQSHKEFVAHVFCQQFLRKEWHGHVRWQGKNVAYKAVYFLLQLFFTPFFMVQNWIIWIARSFRQVFYPDGVPDISQASGRWQRLAFRLMKRADAKVVNLDAPLNRFISASGNYLIFIALLIVATVRPVGEFASEEAAGLAWFHCLIFVFSLAMILQDLINYKTMSPLSNYFTYWRIVDVQVHWTITAAMVVRYYTDEYLPCPPEGQAERTYLCEGDDVRKRSNLIMISDCLLIAGSTGAFTRFLFYMQLNNRIGPVVMNLSRVALDLFSMALIYFLIVASFSSGFLYLLSMERYVADFMYLPNGSLPEDAGQVFDAKIYSYADNATDVYGAVFWSILDPGPSEIFDGDATSMKLARVLFAFFQILAVIVFLNLLIATMNNTIYRVEGSRQLYWKYTRTGIWAEYFENYSSLPPPYTYLMFVSFMIFWPVMSWSWVKRQCQKRSRRIKLGVEEDLAQRKCKGTKQSFRQRMAQGKLLYLLCTRYLKQHALKKAAGEDFGRGLRREDLEWLKAEVAGEVAAKLSSSFSDSATDSEVLKSFESTSSFSTSMRAYPDH